MNSFLHWYLTHVAPVVGSDRDSMAWGFLHGLLAPVNTIYHFFNSKAQIETTSNFAYSFGFFAGVVALVAGFYDRSSRAVTWTRTRVHR